MVRTETKKKIWLGGAAAGVAMMALAILIYSDERSGLSQLLGFAGALAMIFGLIFGLFAARDAGFEARLRAGKDVIAKWRVSAEDWDRFCAFDAGRSAFFSNAAWLPGETPADGVEIVVGKTHILVGDSLHAHKDSLTNTSLICGMMLPADPPCMELVIRTHDKSEDVFYLRFPVPADAGASGERAVQHLSKRGSWGAKIARRFGYDFGRNVPEDLEQVLADVPRRGLLGRNRNQLRNLGCSVAILTPLLGIHFGSMVGHAIGIEWGFALTVAAVLSGLAVGIWTWIANRRAKRGLS
jgi:hypothetical protein